MSANVERLEDRWLLAADLGLSSKPLVDLDLNSQATFHYVADGRAIGLSPVAGELLLGTRQNLGFGLEELLTGNPVAMGIAIDPEAGLGVSREMKVDRSWASEIHPLSDRLVSLKIAPETDWKAELAGLYSNFTAARAPSSEEFWTAPVLQNAESGLRQWVTDEVIVRLEPGVDPEQFFSDAIFAGYRNLKGTNDQFVATFRDVTGLEALELSNQVVPNLSGVVWATLNFVGEVQQAIVPNDPLFIDQWHLFNFGQSGAKFDADIDVEQAWDLVTGNAGVTIAIIDDGFQINHPDLDYWTNVNESPAADGIDTDGNGWIDDINGLNLVDGINTTDNSNLNDPNPTDPYENHGTAVAGSAATRGNNSLGIAAPAYGSKIMALKPFSCTAAAGCFSAFDALARTVYYAAGRTADGNGTWRGADVINISYIINPNTVDTTALNWVTSNGRNGKGTPVFASTGNGASGAKYAWVDIGIPQSLAPGAQVQFRYSKDGSVSSGDDAVWINWAKIPGGTVERFDNETGPPGWDSDGNGDLEWEFSTNPPETARAAGTGRFPYRSGPITHSQKSGLISPEFAVSGSFEFDYWISSEANFDKLEVLVRYRDLFGVWLPWTVTNIKSYDSNGNTVANASASGIAEFTPNAGYPANLDSVIGVGASTDWDYKASYSQYGPGLDIVAPSGGGNIDFWTTDRTGAAGYSTSDYAAVKGTSFASPLAAGVGALMLSRNPELTAAQLQTLMQDTAEEIGSVSYPGGWNQFYGHGRINAHQAVLAAGVDGDDRISQATTISVNATTTGRLGTTSDVDFFQINVNGGDRISIDLDHLSTDLNTDTFVRLFDSAGAVLASSDDTAGPAPEVSGFESYVEFTAPANGAYYIGVSAFGNQNYNPINGNGKTDALPNKLGNYLLRVNNVSSSMLLVNLADDAGDGRYFNGVTLREAVAYANQLFTTPTIQFDTVGLFSTPQTINLSGGQGALPISRSMNINGANRVTVNAQSSSRVFHIDDSTPAVRFVSLSGMSIRGGSAPSGAGILNRENLTLTEVLVTANTTSGDGGGIWSGGQLQVTRSAISNNTANRGGGVYLAVAGNTTTISETTLSGNNASTGGGIANFAGTANIQRSTISENQSGIWSEGNAATTFTNVQSSIVSGNTTEDVVRDGVFFVTIVSQGFNLVGNGTAISAFSQPTDLVGVNPLLGPLGTNGGPTPSHPLLPGSPAVNRGNPSIASPPALDQRGTGFSRIRGGVIDIGAFEAHPPAVGAFGNLVQPSTTQRNYILRANEVVFHQFTLTAPVQAASGQFLVIDTLGTTLAPSNDTEIGLYDASGNRIADNDDGIGLMSRLSFGNTAGSSGDLLAGTYYLAATAFPTTFGNMDFNVTSTSSNTGNVQVNIQVGTAAVPATIVGSFVNHGGYTGSGSPIDTGKVLVKESASSQQLGFNNLINTTRGINGLVFDIAGLPSATLTAADFQFQWSPQGAFGEGANPPASWQAAPAATSITVLPGSTSRVVLQWPDQTIMDRWLRVTVKANPNTGLAAPEVYYLGHLQGKTTEPSGNMFTVRTADIAAIRLALTQSATASSIFDLDKSGLVRTSDIAAARIQLTKQLPQITIPASGGGGGGFVEEDGSIGSAEDSSESVAPTKGLRLLSNPSFQAAGYSASVDSALDDLYSTTQRRRGRRS